MTSDQERKKLDDLAIRIDEARYEADHPHAQDNAEIEPQSQGRNIGYDLIGTVLGSMLLGWLIDRGFGTGPWGLLGMIALGFAAAMVQVWRALGTNDTGPKA